MFNKFCSIIVACFIMLSFNLSVSAKGISLGVPGNHMNLDYDQALELLTGEGGSPSILSEPSFGKDGTAFIGEDFSSKFKKEDIEQFRVKKTDIEKSDEMKAEIRKKYQEECSGWSGEKINNNANDETNSRDWLIDGTSDELIDKRVAFKESPDIAVDNSGMVEVLGKTKTSNCGGEKQGSGEEKNVTKIECNGSGLESVKELSEKTEELKGKKIHLILKNIYCYSSRDGNVLCAKGQIILAKLINDLGDSLYQIDFVFNKRWSDFLTIDSDVKVAGELRKALKQSSLCKVEIKFLDSCFDSERPPSEYYYNKNVSYMGIDLISLIDALPACLKGLCIINIHYDIYLCSADAEKFFSSISKLTSLEEILISIVDHEASKRMVGKEFEFRIFDLLKILGMKARYEEKKEGISPCILLEFLRKKERKERIADEKERISYLDGGYFKLDYYFSRIEIHGFEFMLGEAKDLMDKKKEEKEEEE